MAEKMDSHQASQANADSPQLNGLKPASRKFLGLWFPRVNRRWFQLSLVFMFVALAGAYLFWPRHGIWAREMNETVELPLSPPSDSLWAVEDAFPHLSFFEPTAAVAAKDGTGRMFVLERRGTIQMVIDDPNTKEKTLFLDVFDKIDREPYEDDGALGMVLHPEFGQAGSQHAGEFFVWYTARISGTRRDRLARFTVPEGSDAADPASREILIDQADQNIWHNGGGMAFGPDGFLYVGVGDEGGNEPDEFENGQKIDHKLFSGILRIDVDRRGPEFSHPIKKQPVDGRTTGYDIPNDNPFVGVPNALEEFWSIGLRNPHRIAFDPETGFLWVGDVGQQHREEVNVASHGSNHQWSYAEGHLQRDETYLNGKRPEPYFGFETPPVWDYPHLHGDNCIIGGFVYRGTEFPELVGRYIYGDNGSGRVWALEYDGSEVISNFELMNLPAASKTGLASFGEDAGGEPLIVVLGEADEEDGTIYRLVRGDPETSSPLPKLLSETGLFEDLSTLTPSPGVYPYDVNSPLWSDGAIKRRWIMLPGDGEDPDPMNDRVVFSRDGDWQFPAGTVFVKHFELATNATNPQEIRRLETRVLVRDSLGGAYGMTYVWNENQTDAELVTEGYNEDIAMTAADGESYTQTWSYPGQATCMVCHTKQAGYVLGVNGRQLNGEYAYPGFGVFSNTIVDNQLAAWSHAGLFTQELSETDIANTRSLVSLHDHTARLGHRVQSYMDANCAHCHRPGGVRAEFDARFQTPLADKNLVGHKPLTPMGPDALLVRPGDPSRSLLIRRLLDGAKPMPTVGVLHRDVEAVSVFSRWIDSMPIPPDLEPVQWRPSVELESGTGDPHDIQPHPTHSGL